jgi:hypothetical protein
MGKLVVSLDGVVIKSVALTKDKTTMGRRPYNDIVIDNLAVSGEHAVLQVLGKDVFIEDLGSTNGTYINGKAVKKQLLQNDDTVEIGKYKIKYLVDEADDYEKTMLYRPGAAASAASTQPATGQASGFSSTGFGPPPMSAALNAGYAGLASTEVSAASVKVLNGAAAGKEVSLTKVVTTIGKPGVQVASITKRPSGYMFAHVEGAHRPLLNGQPVLGAPLPLKSGDLIELAGTQMQFVQT